MDRRKLVSDFYRILRLLPNYGRILAVASVATLYCAINPTVKDVGYIHSYSNSIVEQDGKVCFRRDSPLLKKDEVPNFYINTNDRPEPGDNLLMLMPNNNNDCYLYKLKIRGQRADYYSREECLYDYLKDERRKKMYLSFLMSASLCFVAFPSMISRMAELVPKTWRD